MIYFNYLPEVGPPPSPSAAGCARGPTSSKNMIHRIFIAINLPEDIKEKLTRFQKNWPDLPARWLKKETLHITLGFLGNRNEKELEKIFKAIKRVGDRHKPFSILLNKICYGPSTKIPPRLVWAEAEKSQEFSKLKKDLDSLLKKQINFLPDKRQSIAHITLARIKKWNWQRLDTEQRPEINLPISIEIPIKSIEIMESKLKRTGAEYEALWKTGLTQTNN